MAGNRVKSRGFLSELEVMVGDRRSVLMDLKDTYGDLISKTHSN